jgi:hypothetical protein
MMLCSNELDPMILCRFRTTYWITTWSKLSKKKETGLLKGCCHKLGVVMEFFSKFGWVLLGVFLVGPNRVTNCLASRLVCRCITERN